MRTLDIAPLRSESPPQKRSGMARVLSKRFHSFYLTLVRIAQAEIRTRNLPIANPALYHTATSAPDL